jgi:branched-chain amino acid transport system permease protein
MPEGTVHEAEVHAVLSARSKPRSNGTIKKKVVGLSAALVIALVLPQVVTNTYWLGLLNFLIIYSILCLSLNLILGFTGLLSLGHAAFYGIGAYTTAILMTRYHVGFLPAMLASAMLALVFSLFLGIPASKVRGDYFTLLTIAFGEIFRLIAQAWIGFTGGAMGIVGIPIPKVFGMPIRTETQFYYLGLILLAITFVCLTIIVQSRIGRALIAIREDELAAKSMGINTPWYIIMAFTIGSFFAAVAGSFLAVYQTTVTPSNFRLEESCLMIIMVIVGGMGNLWAPLAGVLIMTLATEMFRSLAEYRMLIIGGIMMLVLLFRPQGIFGSSAFKD